MLCMRLSIFYRLNLHVEYVLHVYYKRFELWNIIIYSCILKHDSGIETSVVVLIYVGLY